MSERFVLGRLLHHRKGYTESMSPLGWICLGIGACWAAYVLWDEYFRPSHGDGKGGFWDFVKNPGVGNGRRRHDPPGKAFPLPDVDTPAVWDASLRKAIEQQWDTFEYVRMADRSPHVAPAAARLMRDSAFVGKAWSNPDKGLPHWNLSALQILLGKVVPTDVLPHVEPFLAHDNGWCRQCAGEILGRIDDEHAAEAQRRCIKSDDKHVRDGLFHGMASTVYERTGSRGLILALWSDLCEALASERIKYSSVSSIIRRMAEADRERACADLHAGTVLRWNHRNLDDILAGLHGANIPPARSVILDLAARWQQEATPEWSSPYHRGKVLGACLMLLLPDNAVEADPETKALVMSMMEDSSKETRSSACPAFLRMHGLTVDPGRICHSILYERKGILSQQQRAYMEVQTLLAEVQNGGWHQYFVNSSGDGWKHCLAGAEEMGLLQVVEDMKRATALFGPDGPDVNRDRRWERLSKFTKHQDKVLEELGIEGDSVEVAMARYAVLHRDEFLPSLIC